jgi:hypothetical protein
MASNAGDTAGARNGTLRIVAVRPAVGGPQSTFRVVVKPMHAVAAVRVTVAPRCSGSVRAFPWEQLLQLVGPPITQRLGAIQLPRPVGGWCTGRFRGTFVDSATKQVLAHFTFRVKRGVSTPLPERPCRPRGSSTLAETRTARIFTLQVGQGDYDSAEFTEGCVFSVRGHIQLAWAVGFLDSNMAEPETLTSYKLAGPFAGFVKESPGPADYTRTLDVTDLRTGRLLWSVSADFGISDFEVQTQTGALAWIGAVVDGPGASGSQPLPVVSRVNSSGIAELDRGTGIDVRSLRLRGSMLTWIHDGITKSATL